MTQYLLSVMHDPAEDARMAAMTPEELQATFAAVDAFNTEVQAQGAWVFAGGLEPIEAATTVDGSGVEPILTDGPYAESKEYLGGFWIIDVADLDAALALAAAGSRACGGRVEVRPFQAEPPIE